MAKNTENDIQKMIDNAFKPPPHSPIRFQIALWLRYLLISGSTVAGIFVIIISFGIGFDYTFFPSALLDWGFAIMAIGAIFKFLRFFFDIYSGAIGYGIVMAFSGDERRQDQAQKAFTNIYETWTKSMALVGWEMSLFAGGIILMTIGYVLS